MLSLLWFILLLPILQDLYIDFPSHLLLDIFCWFVFLSTSGSYSVTNRGLLLHVYYIYVAIFIIPHPQHCNSHLNNMWQGLFCVYFFKARRIRSCFFLYFYSFTFSVCLSVYFFLFVLFLSSLDAPEMVLSLQTASVSENNVIIVLHRITLFLVSLMTFCSTFFNI